MVKEERADGLVMVCETCGKEEFQSFEAREMVALVGTLPDGTGKVAAKTEQTVGEIWAFIKLMGATLDLDPKTLSKSQCAECDEKGMPVPGFPRVTAEAS